MAKGILVHPTIIRWAVRASKKNLDTLSEKFNKLGTWVTEESELTVSELNKLSKELKIPFGYFFLDNPPIEDIQLLKYRTVDNIETEHPSRELIDTIKEMEVRQEFMRDFLIEDGFLPLDFVGSATLDNDIEQLAQNIKEILGLNSSWNRKNPDAFKTLREAVSSIGILVMQNGVVGSNNKRVLDVAEFRAFVLIDKYAPLIFLNATDSYNAKIFSLCHELIHIWLGINELYNDNFSSDQLFNNENLETFCNEVAAELLLPFKNIQTIYSNKYDIFKNIELLSKEFSVSELVVCIRLKNKNFISNKDFETVYSILVQKMNESLLNRKYNAKKPGGNYYYTVGTRLDSIFVNSVNRKAKEGKILYTEAYRLVGAKGKTYDNLMKYMEGK